MNAWPRLPCVGLVYYSTWPTTSHTPPTRALLYVLLGLYVYVSWLILQFLWAIASWNFTSMESTCLY